MKRTRAAALLSIWGFALAFTPNVRAQCQVWSPTIGNPGLYYTPGSYHGVVNLLGWFDDGNGPALYAGGSFNASGSTALSRLARHDASGWNPVGGIVLTTGFLNTMLGYDDGSGPSLFVCGQFDLVASGHVNGIGRFDGTNWHALGGGTAGSVRSLCVFDSGIGDRLFAGGGFSSMGGVAGTSNLARWDGNFWAPVGGGVSGSIGGGAISSLVVFDDGSGPGLCVGGYFDNAGSVPAARLALWKNGVWSDFGTQLNGIYDHIDCLAVFDDGTGPALYVGGSFSAIGGVSATNIARWTSASGWSALGSGLNIGPRALAVFDDGSGKQLYAGGNFDHSGSQTIWHIARWNGAFWSDVASGVDGPVHALLPFDDGTSGGKDLYLGGEFFVAQGLTSNNVAEWHGCAAPGTNFCDGDGNVMPCPCGNSGAPGHGCMNSTGLPARLASAGSVLPDTLRLTAAAEPASAVTIFLQGDLDLSPGVNFGDGLRCTGGALKRLYVKNAAGGTVQVPAAGDPSVHDASANAGDPLAPGSTRYYQAYYRDGNPTFCPPPQGASFNVTNGVKIVW